MKLEKILKASIPIVIGAYVIYRVYQIETKERYLDLDKVREAGL